MIAVDTGSFIAYLAGEQGSDVDAVDAALVESQVCLPPVVLTELFSDAKLRHAIVKILEHLPVLEVNDGYWRRAGALRARVLSLKRKARLADALIAQSCLDHDLPLIARDRDFKSFARVSRLKLLP